MVMAIEGPFSVVQDWMHHCSLRGHFPKEEIQKKKPRTKGSESMR
jgi:hypothetical protein